MDAIIESPGDRQSELTALARLVIYAQASARDLGAKEVDDQLGMSLLAIVRELESPSNGPDLSLGNVDVPSLGRFQ